MAKKKTKVNKIGLEAKHPKAACESTNCPWHGHLKIRGRVFRGTVVSAKGVNTAIVQWNYYNFISKYERYERRKTRIAAHNPKCINAAVGDMVQIGECRPVSKSKSFVIFEKLSDKE